MRRWPIVIACVFGLFVPLAAAGQAGPGPDAEGVRRAALDYLEGFYEGDASKIRRSIRPEVRKFGFFRDSSSGAWASEPMTFEQMIAYAEQVKASGRGAPAGAPKEVRILDVQDQTAAVKVTAWWGTDYLQLAKYNDRWMILHVLWQTPPAAR